MESTRPATLIASFKVFWRSFAPAWAFPIAFLFGGLTAEDIGHPQLFFWLVAMPLFFWSFFRATRPWMEQKIYYWLCMFWAMVVPFLIWSAAVFSRLAILKLMGGAHGA